MGDRGGGGVEPVVAVGARGQQGVLGGVEEGGLEGRQPGLVRRRDQVVDRRDEGGPLGLRVNDADL